MQPGENPSTQTPAICPSALSEVMLTPYSKDQACTINTHTAYISDL